MPEEASGISSQNKGSWGAFLKSISLFNGDLSSMTAPAFILSGVSLTEFSAYWAQHPSLFVAPAAESDPKKRTLLVLKWFLSTLRQQYASRSDKYGNEKKPLNPFLGELFLGEWEHDCGITSLVSEQVSHHPPVTAYRIANEKNEVYLEGYNAQKASFSRTINVKQIGRAIYSLPTYNETYLISLPNLHIEGLIYGSPFVELNSSSYISCSSGYVAQIDYCGKGWLSGKKNRFTAKIYPTGNEKEILYSASGQWSKTFEFREGEDGPILEKFDSDANAVTPLTVAPIEQQSPLESRRAWRKVAAGITEGNMKMVHTEKTKIEEAQRALRVKEKEMGVKWESKYFSVVESDAVVDQLGHTISLASEPDKTGGIWKFDEAKATAAKNQKHMTNKNELFYEE